MMHPFSIEEFSRELTLLGNKWSCLYLSECESTNDEAKQLRLEKGEEKGIVVTDYQVVGRGQYNRKWNSAPNENILCSLVLIPSKKVGINLLGLLMATAICEGIKEFDSHQNLAIKWPNDVQMNGKKLAGILVETQISGSFLEKVIIGFGINVNQLEFDEELANKATSLYLESGSYWNREKLLAQIIHQFESWYELWLENDYAVIAAIHNRLIGVETYQSIKSIQGKVLYPKAWILGLDERGRLGILDENEQEKWFEHEQIRLESLY